MCVWSLDDNLEKNDKFFNYTIHTLVLRPDVCEGRISRVYCILCIVEKLVIFFKRSHTCFDVTSNTHPLMIYILLS